MLAPDRSIVPAPDLVMPPPAVCWVIAALTSRSVPLVAPLATLKAIVVPLSVRILILPEITEVMAFERVVTLKLPQSKYFVAPLLLTPPLICKRPPLSVILPVLAAPVAA